MTELELERRWVVGTDTVVVGLLDTRGEEKIGYGGRDEGGRQSDYASSNA